MEDVIVVMSTYNGEKYISEQIDSIFNQRNVNVTLFIRDDGSTDNTIGEIERMMQKYHGRILYRCKENLGVGNSFMQALYEAYSLYPDASWFAFSDQDDIWLEDKLKNGIESLRMVHCKNVLYASNQILIDKMLIRREKRFSRQPDIGYGQILRGNEISGCTFIMDKSLVKFLVDEANRPSEGLLKARIHDVWIAEIASLFGKIIYDDTGYILYRQHDSNEVGAIERNKLYRIRRGVRNIFSRHVSDFSKAMAGEIISIFKDDLGEKKEILMDFLHYTDSFNCKIRIIKEEAIFRKSYECRLLYVFKALLSKL